MVRWFWLILILAACQSNVTNPNPGGNPTPQPPSPPPSSPPPPNPQPVVNGEATLNPPLAASGERVTISLPFTPTGNAKVKVGGANVNSSLTGGLLRFNVPSNLFGGPQTVEVNDAPNSAAGTLEVLKVSNRLPPALQNVAKILTDNPEGFKTALENLPGKRGTYQILGEPILLAGTGRCGKAIVRVKISGISFGEGLLELKRLESESGGLALHVDPLSGWATDPGGLAPQALTMNGATEMGAGAAQQRNIRGQGTIIAILDSGVTPVGVLSRQIVKGTGRNFTEEGTVNDVSDQFKPTGSTDVVGHGTPAAILANRIAPLAELLPVKVCDATGLCISDDVVQGVCYALDYASKNGGAKKLVMNLSLGGETPSVILHDVLKEALEQGAVVVAAAGNGWEGRATGAGELFEYPAAFGGVNGLPDGWASLEGKGLIAVGALLKDVVVRASVFKATAFTNRGDYVDVAAPGERVLSNGPADPSGTQREYTGTSFATPLVAGAAALWRGAQPNATPAQVEQWLEENAKGLPVGDAPKAAVGAGLVDVSQKP